MKHNNQALGYDCHGTIIRLTDLVKFHTKDAKGPIKVGQVINRYSNGELVIRCQNQRYRRWPCNVKRFASCDNANRIYSIT